jgi:hypothetical protein
MFDDDDDVEDLLAQVDELIKLAVKVKGTNGGRDRKVLLSNVRKYLRSYERTQSISDVLIAMELLSEIIMGER